MDAATTGEKGVAVNVLSGMSMDLPDEPRFLAIYGRAESGSQGPSRSTIFDLAA
jgi:hypothetical protein